MHRGLAGNTREFSIDDDAWNPGEAFAGEDQRPRVALLPRYARVDQDVLQLARANAAGRPHAKAGPAKSQVHVQARPQVRRVGIVAAGAALDVEPGSGAARRARHHFHIRAHDTKTQASRKIDASTPPPASHQLDHPAKLPPR